MSQPFFTRSNSVFELIQFELYNLNFYFPWFLAQEGEYIPKKQTLSNFIIQTTLKMFQNRLYKCTDYKIQNLYFSDFRIRTNKKKKISTKSYLSYTVKKKTSITSFQIISSNYSKDIFRTTKSAQEGRRVEREIPLLTWFFLYGVVQTNMWVVLLSKKNVGHPSI